MEADDHRVSGCFKMFNKNNNGLLSLEEFLNSIRTIKDEHTINIIL